MKVSLSIIGRFHFFYLANQLKKHDALHQLITSYPKFEAVKYDIPRNKVDSIIIKEILQRGWGILPKFVKKLYNPQYLLHEIFDKKSSKLVKNDTDILTTTASLYKHTIKKAKNENITVVVDSGSAHASFQKEILKEEYEKFNVDYFPFQISDKRIFNNTLKSYKESDYIFVPSSFAKRTFLKKGFSKEKIVKVPYGVDLSEFRQVKKQDDIFRVVFAGGMTLQKGVHYLLKAFNELNLPDSELILLGSKSPEIKPFFKKYNVIEKQELGKGNGEIRFLGHKPQKELYNYYSQGSVYCQPSIQDGFGMVIIQAMSCGLPVIATENTGGPDVIKKGENGFISPIRDIDYLKDKLTYLYENRDKCKQMGQNAKKHVSSGFSWDDYGDKIVKEYSKILKKNNE